MILDRRRLMVAAVPALAAWSALADEAPPAIAAYEHDTDGRIFVYAENLATRAKIAWRADERVIICSTFKASLAACVLSRIDHGDDHLDSLVPYAAKDLEEYAPVARENLSNSAMSVADMCQATVELSDNTCANLLLARIGGPAALTAFWRTTGDTISRLDHNEPLLNRSPPGDPHDTTTAKAMADNLRRFVLGDVLSPASRERLTGWLVGCKTGANRLRGGLPASWRVGDKTGNNGKDAFGDIAVAWPTRDAPVLICAYTQGGSPTPAQVTKVFAEIGRMVAQKLG